MPELERRKRFLPLLPTPLSAKRKYEAPSGSQDLLPPSKKNEEKVNPEKEEVYQSAALRLYFLYFPAMTVVLQQRKLFFLR